MVPDSFPARLAAAPTEGARQRRFIIIDEVVYDLYGDQLEQVSFALAPDSVLSSIAWSLNLYQSAACTITQRGMWTVHSCMHSVVHYCIVHEVVCI